jgi:alpha-glucosidase
MQTSEVIHPEKLADRQTTGNKFIVGRVTDWKQTGQSLLVFGEHANVAVSFLRDQVVRVTLFFDSIPNLATTVAVLPTAQTGTSYTVHEETDQILVSTSELRVSIHKPSFALTVLDKNGQTVFHLTDIVWNARRQISCFALMETDTHVYGLGETTGFLDKRGERYTMWNTDVYAPHVPEIESLYQSIPFLLAHRYGKPAYGLFLDNPGKTVFDMRSFQDRLIFTTETGGLDFYFLYGPTLKDVIRRYTDLTGRMPLPPKWAIGYHQSRYSYMDQEEVLELARTFRAKQIPCDAIYLDIHYMDEYRVFTWDPVRFPNPKAMMQELNEMGFQVVPIVDPGVKKDPKYPIYREGIEKGMFCRKLEGELFTGPVWPGESCFPDFTDDKVAKWWGDNHQFYVDCGIRGIWNDMNEPSVFQDSKTMDLDVMHNNNGNPKTHEELHNLYGMLMSKATYEGLKRQLQGTRPFVLTRAGYSGIQRYAAVWTGDNRSFWEHMALAIPMVLNLGMSGVAFSGPDLGGFAHHASGELLARWMQMGVFFPFCRNHSAIETARQEPWAFGPEVEKICRTYIRLRYSWMPYLYSLFHEASKTGLPILRPLILEFPEDPNVFNLCDQFLVGSQVLVAPILRPGTTARSVYLPEGIWYDYWSGKRYEGNRHILVEAPLDRLPLFIKAGAILPQQPWEAHTSEQSSTLLIQVFAGLGNGASQFHLYDDDGISFAYEQGKYDSVQFDLQETPQQLELRYTYLTKGYTNHYDQIQIQFKHLPFVPQPVEGGIYDSQNHVLTVTIHPYEDGVLHISKK